ncbi:HupE/UreJ family protein [Opitutales bacterium]|nr:HupE/UreJ family protein [Opitutales bacterium]
MKILKFLLIFPLLSAFLHGHPIPDIPVIGKFYSDGNSSIYIEIDTRSFAEDPEQVPFLIKSAFKQLSDSNKTDLILQAKSMIKNALQVRFGNNDWYLPEFIFDFVEQDGGDLSEENILVLQGQYDIALDNNSSFYQIRSLEEAPYDLVFTNQINGKPQRRVNVLFPNEESFKFDLSFIDGKPIAQNEIEQKSGSIVEKSSEERKEDARSTFYSFTRQGFVHVLPLGLDHILFVLGLFFLSRKWKPILYQVSVFTIAHTITLGLATLELISAPSHVVEPIIAASIAVVALENIFFPNYRHSRLFIVFFFGLIHGLGFAGALSAFDLDPTSLVIGLLGFNVGVEFGQLAVIAIVFALTFWLKDETKYRKLAVVPCSTLIALMGIYWTIERIFF